MKLENSANLKIFEFSVEILLFKSSKMLNISDQLLSLQTLIRFSLFSSISTSDLTQTADLEVSNSHEINSISHLIRTMIKIKILTVIEIVTEIVIKTEIKTETETEIVNIKIKVEVKITIKNSDFIVIFI